MLFDLYDVEADLIQGLNTHQEHKDFEKLDLTNENDRWLATSALQKSIRRGNEAEALKAAYVLNSFSTTHLWGRLKVIALVLANPMRLCFIKTLATVDFLRKICNMATYCNIRM